MIVISMITEDYLDRARMYLDSLRFLKYCSSICLTVDFNIDDNNLHKYYWTFFHRIASHSTQSSTGIIQHGRWIGDLPPVDELSSDGNPLIMLTDTDLILQRDFTEAELSRFNSYDDKTFGAAWNAGEKDNLLEEAKRLSMDLGFDIDLGNKLCEEYKEIPCYNTGVLVMRKSAWENLCEIYEKHCEEFYKKTTNRSRGQWLICWCLSKLGFKSDLLGPELHSHGHFGVEENISLRDGKAYASNRLIMFRHAF